MDYLLDNYFFNYLPIEVSEETRKVIGQKAVTIVQYADWFCKYQDPRKIYENHSSFLFGELLFFFLATLTFIHAYRNGGRLMYVWIGILIHALNVENLCYWIPDMDNFWQAQGILTFFGMRAPLYILYGIYHMFDYCAYVMVSRLRLPWWAEGPAVGLCAVMLDMPYDIMGIKLVWWTWHDTDPNIYDRMYWVPWNSYYFHASFACSFVWILNLSRKYLLETAYDWRKFPRELLCSFLAGTLAFWLGTIQFAIIYHPIHDFFGVHTEITTCLFLSIYALIVITADRHNGSKPGTRTGNKYWFDEISCAIACEYLFYMILVIVADPVNIVAEGLHQPIGNCDEKQKVQTPTGLVLYKNKYLCANKYDEKYFDFHCIPNGGVNGLKMPEDGSPLEWYATCGTDFDNRAEYIVIIWGICILYSWIFYQMAARSGAPPEYPVKIYQPRKRPDIVEKNPLLPGKTRVAKQPISPNSSKTNIPVSKKAIQSTSSHVVSSSSSESSPILLNPQPIPNDSWTTVKRRPTRHTKNVTSDASQESPTVTPSLHSVQASVPKTMPQRKKNIKVAK